MKNDQLLTYDSCRKNKLNFLPRTIEEARGIQSCLFELGFEWADHVVTICHLNDCVDGGMLLEKGKLYYNLTSESRRDGLLCTLNQFETPLPPSPDESPAVPTASG